MAKLSLQERVSDHMCKQYQFSIDKVATMLPTFLNVLQNHMRDMESALAQGEVGAIAKVGHTLKGALLNLGLDDVAEIAKTIETEGMADNQDIDYSELVTQLQKQLEEIL